MPVDKFSATRLTSGKLYKKVNTANSGIRENDCWNNLCTPSFTACCLLSTKGHWFVYKTTTSLACSTTRRRRGSRESIWKMRFSSDSLCIFPLFIQEPNTVYRLKMRLTGLSQNVLRCSRKQPKNNYKSVVLNFSQHTFPREAFPFACIGCRFI